MLRPTFSGPDAFGMVHAELPLEGRWNGLTIRSIGHGFVPNSGVSYQRIVFAEPPEVARAKLNSMGFNLPPRNEARQSDDGMAEYISISAHDLGSALECST